MVVVLLILLCHPGCDRGSSSYPKKPAASSPPSPKTEVVPLTDMVFIKAGSFVRLKHSVTLSRDFWLHKYEVTQGEYASVMGKNPSQFPGDTNRPVEKLSYFDAVAYCSAVTKHEREAGRLPPGYAYRLPSEAEWEYACRAGTTNFFSFGDAVAEADQYAWTLENSEGTTHPIGQKRPNPWGLYDMHGNVWEWCNDWFAPYPAAELTDPSGPTNSKFKVFRGGGWNQAIEFARSANRFMMAPSNGIHFVGFRLALSQTQQ
jgi:formylglycine-generating enzyme required for sulfatase activity